MSFLARLFAPDKFMPNLSVTWEFAGMSTTKMLITPFHTSTLWCYPFEVRRFCDGQIFVLMSRATETKFWTNLVMSFEDVNNVFPHVDFSRQRRIPYNVHSMLCTTNCYRLKYDKSLENLRRTLIRFTVFKNPIFPLLFERTNEMTMTLASSPWKLSTYQH